jgi:hypothetical protein
MSQLQIRLANDLRNFKPGDIVQGTVNWELTHKCDHVEVRLFWTTEGVGAAESGLIETVMLKRPQTSEVRPFTFRLPAFPYSYQGVLTSVSWVLEAVAFPGKQNVKETIIMAPTARLIVLVNAARSFPAAA